MQFTVNFTSRNYGSFFGTHFVKCGIADLDEARRLFGSDIKAEQVMPVTFEYSNHQIVISEEIARKSGKLQNVSEITVSVYGDKYLNTMAFLKRTYTKQEDTVTVALTPDNEAILSLWEKTGYHEYLDILAKQEKEAKENEEKARNAEEKARNAEEKARQDAEEKAKEEVKKALIRAWAIENGSILLKKRIELGFEYSDLAINEYKEKLCVDAPVDRYVFSRKRDSLIEDERPDCPVLGVLEKLEKIKTWAKEKAQTDKVDLVYIDSEEDEEETETNRHIKIMMTLPIFGEECHIYFCV